MYTIGMVRTAFLEKPEKPLWLHVALFVLGWIGFQAIGVLIYSSISARLINTFGLAPGVAELAITTPSTGLYVTLMAYIAVFIVLVSLTNRYHLDFVKQLKRRQTYIGIAIGVLLVGVTIALAMIINSIRPMGDNANESSLNAMGKQNLFVMSIITVVLAPVCEELTYRVGLFSGIAKKNRPLAYVITAIVFGLIHFDFDSFFNDNFVNEILNLPIYVTSGLIMCYAYDKYGFAGSLLVHMTNNLIATFF